ncbi:hypothetical protein POM88_029109 [Heracleum sosnowskyi]|uniref:Uncharacterized protein n=1 Tax=Heracleum sosnowskyi TaxID=360622 RepID=A0AAD8MGY5_9APIA|nr:hypothetical protein POM88_029109 [Heracleum sosnowskyi]
MEVESLSVNEISTLVRTKVRRRIDYFFLDRMVELLQSYDNVSNSVMEHVLKYKDERDMKFYQKYGMFEDHDDADIAHLLEYSDEETPDYDDDFPTEEEVQAQPSQERPSNPTGKETAEDVEASLLSKCKEANKLESEGPNYQPCVLENPLRIKFIREEIPVRSFHKLKTSALKDLLYMVIGSTHLLEQMCSFEIEDILQRRKCDDSKLDKSRRKTLNAYPRRRFKLVEGNLKFRTFAFGQELWTDVQDAKVCLSKVVQKYIDEIEDDATFPDEISMVEGLREILKEALNKEDVARQKRKSEAK